MSVLTEDLKNEFDELNNSLMEKERIYLDYREHKIDTETFLQSLRKIDNPERKGWKVFLAVLILIVLSLIFPFGIFKRHLN